MIIFWKLSVDKGKISWLADRYISISALLVWWCKKPILFQISCTAADTGRELVTILNFLQGVWPSISFTYICYHA